MPANYITIRSDSELGNVLKSGIRQLVGSIGLLTSLQASMVQSIDGTDFSALETVFGVQAGRGPDLKGELDSLLGKLTGNGSVTNVNAAIRQAAAKVGAYSA